MELAHRELPLAEAAPDEIHVDTVHMTPRLRVRLGFKKGNDVAGHVDIETKQYPSDFYMHHAQLDDFLQYATEEVERENGWPDRSVELKIEDITWLTWEGLDSIVVAYVSGGQQAPRGFR